MSGPFGEISLVPRFNLEVESIRPVQDLILGFYLVISVAFHLETLAVYQVAASLLLLEWQVKKFSRNTLHASSSSAISALRVGITHPPQIRCVALDKINREPRTEPKEPRIGTERTGTENFGSLFGSHFSGTELTRFFRFLSSVTRKNRTIE
jgi:hypothetical protein